MSSENNPNYQVLARQWRPKNFADVVWQNHVTQALENALNAQRIHHAYLFTGTRGVGKTTLARIMAKCLSCQKGVSATPCDECDHCLAIQHGQYIDLIEVDAASRTKVEDTRELLDNIAYAPSSGRYKIYLIDEVHMLSSHSFNALLKTLEEPPEHVKFLFATTDPQRLPATLLSRCLQFHLKAIPNEEIVQRLAHILTQEKLSAETEALTIVAQAAQGSLRDALSILDQVIDYRDRSVSATRTRALLGLTDPTLVLEVLQAIVEQQPQVALTCYDQLCAQSSDVRSVLDQLLDFLQIMAIAKHCPSHVTQHPQQQQLVTLGDKLTAEDIQLYYQIVLHGRRDLAIVPTITQGVQMTLLRLFAFAPESSVDNLPPPRRLAQTNLTSVTSNAAATEPAKPNAKPAVTHAAESKVSYQATDWLTVIDRLGLTGITHTLAQHCSCADWNGLQITLLLTPSYAAFLSDVQKSRLQEALRHYTGENIQLHINIATHAITTPAIVQTQQALAAKENTQKALEQDDALKLLLTALDGKIEVDSIEPTTHHSGKETAP